MLKHLSVPQSSHKHRPPLALHRSKVFSLSVTVQYAASPTLHQHILYLFCKYSELDMRPQHCAVSVCSEGTDSLTHTSLDLPQNKWLPLYLITQRSHTVCI